MSFCDHDLWALYDAAKPDLAEKLAARLGMGNS